MNRYDKESIIISDFQDFSRHDVLLFPHSKKTISIFNSVHSKIKWKKWIDSSSKSELPPDFYNSKSKLMMDVMRIDDHAYVDSKGNVINPHNKRESELVKELISKNEFIREIAEQGHLFITPYTGLSSYDDHNYNFYVNNFKRVIEKHIMKIKKYRCNHPGFKMIFFILDESSPYVKCFDDNRPSKIGEIICGQPHTWWFDKNMMDCLINSDIDYIIWMTPYKHFNSIQKFELPKATIIDIKSIDLNEMAHYNPSDMQSLEM